MLSYVSIGIVSCAGTLVKRKYKILKNLKIAKIVVFFTQCEYNKRH